MRKSTLARAMAGTAVMVWASWAQGAVIFSDNFDAYANQTAFQTVWSITGTAAVNLATSPVLSSPNSVGALTTATRSGHSFGDIAVPTDADNVHFTFAYYDSNGAAAAYRQYGELIDGAGTSSMQLIAMGLSNNIASTKYMARVLGYDGGSGANAFFQLNDAGSPSRSTGWHKFDAYIGATSIQFYVDGILSKTANITGLTARQYDVVRMGSNLSSTQTANFDDVLVERANPVPEPATMVLLGLGALLMRARVRRGA